MKFNKRYFVGFVLLSFQLGMIVFARFTDARYFCWAPHDSQNEYQLQVILNGKTLSDAEIRKRYRINQNGIDPRSIRHIKDILSRYEMTYGKENPASIVMDYQTNGREQATWRWPKP